MPPKLDPKSNTERVQIVAPASWIKLLKDWRRTQPELPSMSEAVRLLAERGLAFEWRPLGTAPTDETAVLLYFPRGYWRTGEPIAIGFWSEGEWYAGEADSEPMTAFGDVPTHWMPLPSPPRLEKGQDDE